MFFTKVGDQICGSGHYKSTERQLGLHETSQLALTSTISLDARVFLFLVPLVIALDPVAAHAAVSGDFAGLVDIGGGRKMYLECHALAVPRSCSKPAIALPRGCGARIFASRRGRWSSRA